MPVKTVVGRPLHHTSRVHATPYLHRALLSGGKSPPRILLEELMADIELRDVEQCFPEGQRPNSDGVGMQRVIDSMKRLHLLRREEIYAVAYWIKMRLCSDAAAP